jgi:hypothetical protein
MGLSNKGAMGLPGAGAQGFGVVNQGVTRRMPGEGPDGGRNQSQEMDSMDQPQYKLGEMFGVEEIKDVPDRMKKVKDDLSKLKASSNKEKKEHPWMSKKQATHVAKDHEKLGEGIAKVFVVKKG